MAESKVARILEEERTKLTARKTELTTELESIQAELDRIDAYFNTAVPKATRTHASGSSRRGSVQPSVLETLSKYPDGMTRGEIIEAMGRKGDKAGGQSISNALSALNKQHKISSKAGKWIVA
jgi:hypothetical protein